MLPLMIRLFSFVERESWWISAFESSIQARENDDIWDEVELVSRGHLVLEILPSL